MPALAAFLRASRCPTARRSLHTAEDAADTKWVTQQWIARGLAGAPLDPIQAALTGSLPLSGGSSIGSRAGSSSSSSGSVAPQRRRAPAADEAPSAAELALLAAKRGKKGGKKKDGAGSGKGFGG